MRAMDLKKAIETFEKNADGDGYRIHVYLRCGTKITGEVHPFNDGSAVWIDAAVDGDGVLPTSVSIESIDAVQWGGPV